MKILIFFFLQAKMELDIRRLQVERRTSEMTIGKVTLNQINPTPAVNAESTATSNSKNIQNQITTKEQHLNRLSSDDKLSAAEKEKKRREIQKEIDELNRKLELMRMRKEEAEKKAESQQQKADARKAELLAKDIAKADSTKQISSEKAAEAIEKSTTDQQKADATKPVEDEKPKRVDMPIEDVQKMLTADYELQKELTQKHVDTQVERKVNVIESEMKQDERLGADTKAKEAEIEAIETKQNFWTEEAKKQQTAEQKEVQTETNKATGMHIHAAVNVDTI